MYTPGTKTFIENMDVKVIYLHVKGNLNNFESFKKQIRYLATEYNGKYIYKDENKLFEAFRKAFPEYFQTRDLKNLSELISLVHVEDYESLAFRFARRRFPAMRKKGEDYYYD